MQNSEPSNSCTISIALDGDVAFFVSDPGYVPGYPCEAAIEGTSLSIRQDDGLNVVVPGVSEEFRNAILGAGSLVVVNVRNLGRPEERMSVNRLVQLIGKEDFHEQA